MLEQMNSGHRSRELEVLDQGSPLIMKENKTAEFGEIKLKKHHLPKPKITDFEIHEVVGIGNFGKVYKATNKKLKRLMGQTNRKVSQPVKAHIDRNHLK